MNGTPGPGNLGAQQQPTGPAQAGTNATPYDQDPDAVPPNFDANNTLPEHGYQPVDRPGFPGPQQPPGNGPTFQIPTQQGPVDVSVQSTGISPDGTDIGDGWTAWDGPGYQVAAKSVSDDSTTVMIAQYGPEAPQQYSFALNLPQGDTMSPVANPPNSFGIFDQNQTQIGTITQMRPLTEHTTAQTTLRAQEAFLQTTLKADSYPAFSGNHWADMNPGALQDPPPQPPRFSDDLPDPSNLSDQELIKQWNEKVDTYEDFKGTKPTKPCPPETFATLCQPWNEQNDFLIRELKIWLAELERRGIELDEPWQYYPGQKTNPLGEMPNLETGPQASLNPRSVNGYTNHALDRMQERGITRGQVEDVVDNPIADPERQIDPQGRVSWKYIGEDDLEVILNDKGSVITAYYP